MDPPPTRDGRSVALSPKRPAALGAPSTSKRPRTHGADDEEEEERSSPRPSSGDDPWYCFLVVRTGHRSAREPLHGIHVAPDPFAYVASLSAHSGAPLLLAQQHPQTHRREPRIKEAPPPAEREDAMQMERVTEVPFWRRSRRDSATADRELGAFLAMPLPPQMGAERAATEIARIARGDSRSLLPRAVPASVTPATLSLARGALSTRPRAGEAARLRLAMIMGPLPDEPSARLVRRLWQHRLEVAPAKDEPEEDRVVRAAEWGELVAAWFRFALHSDLVAVFDAHSELRHHVLQQTATGELWLVERERAARPKPP